MVMSNREFDVAIEAAQRKGQKHFPCCYMVEALADPSVQLKDVLGGSPIAMTAWLADAPAYWSFTLHFYGVDDDAKPAFVATNQRVPGKQKPSVAINYVNAALDDACKSNPDVDVIRSVVNLTMSLVPPKSTYGQGKGKRK